MKKVLSLMLALCLVAGFMAINVAAAPAFGLVAEVENTAGGADVTLKVTGDVTLSGWSIYMQYDASKATFASATKEFTGYTSNWALGTPAAKSVKVSIGNGAYAQYKGNTYTFIEFVEGTTVESDYVTVVSGTDLVLAKISFTGEGITAADFNFNATPTTANAKVSTVLGTSLKVNCVDAFNTLNASDAEYVTIKAAASEEDNKTTTFNKVYKADDGKSAAVFGKAPAGTAEAGLYIEKDGEALEHKTAMRKTEKGAGYFPAYKSDITAAFGVIIRDLAPGNYSAKIYADDTFGDAQSFTIAE